MHPDVLVVGGGITGAGVARDLALRGVDTTLVERGALAGGTSGRSHGVLHSGARYADTDPDDAADCLWESRTLREMAAGCVDDTGGYMLELKQDDPAYFERKRQACAAVGMETETIDGDELRRREPAASQAVERALKIPDAVVSPGRLVAANVAGARAAGATIHTNAPVDSIRVTDGRVEAIEIGGECSTTVDAEVVVNATGPWAGRLADLAGVSVPVRPTRGAMVAVDEPDAGVGAVLNRCRPAVDGDIVVPRPGEAVLGTTSVPVDDPDAFERSEREVERVVSETAAMCPAVADQPVRRTYWGVRPLYAPDDATGRSASRGFGLLDHAADGAAGLVTVIGGKLTTYRLMAAETADLVCDRLGVAADCRTADEPLPGAPERLDELVEELAVEAPAEAV